MWVRVRVYTLVKDCIDMFEISEPVSVARMKMVNFNAFALVPTAVG